MAQIGALYNYEKHRCSVKSETDQTMVGPGQNMVLKANPCLASSQRESQVAPLEEISYICGDCGRSFVGHLRFTEHQKTHKEKIYTCVECRQTYTHETALNRHLQSHIIPEPHRCMECHQCFVKNSDLIEHQQSHRSEKTCRCTEVGLCQSEQAAHQWKHSCEAFEMPASRKRTLRTRTQENRCSQSSVCGRSFSDTRHRDQHPKTHKVLNSSQCHTSYQHFHQRADVDRDEKMHTGVKLYTCPHCRSDFRLKGSLTLHMKIHRKLCNPD